METKGGGGIVYLTVLLIGWSTNLSSDPPLILGYDFLSYKLLQRKFPYNLHVAIKFEKQFTSLNN